MEKLVAIVGGVGCLLLTTALAGCSSNVNAPGNGSVASISDWCQALAEEKTVNDQAAQAIPKTAKDTQAQIDAAQKVIDTAPPDVAGVIKRFEESFIGAGQAWLHDGGNEGVQRYAMSHPTSGDDTVGAAQAVQRYCPPHS